ncbi:prolyl oligopeptidase family serine peptidase [Aliidiomarina sp. Khilg15.8]
MISTKQRPQRRLNGLALALASALVLSGIPATLAQDTTDSEKRPLQLTDIMKFREIEQRVLSESGNWMAYAAVPDLGDSTGYVVNVVNGREYSVERGDQPVISNDGRYVVFRQRPALLEREQADDDEARDKLKNNAVLVDTQTGDQRVFEDVDSFHFSGNGQTLALMLNKADKEDDGHPLRIVSPSGGNEHSVDNVLSVAAGETGPRFAWVSASNDETPLHSVTVFNSANGTQLTIAQGNDLKFSGLSFNPDGNMLALLQGPRESDNPDPAQQLLLWQFGEAAAEQVGVERDGWVLSEHQSPHWSEDGARLLLGHRPQRDDTADEMGAPESEEALYDLERLLDDRRLQVWHGEDDRIVTHQRETYDSQQKSTAPGVLWVEDAKFVALSDDLEDRLRWSEHDTAAILSNSSTHLRNITWDGFYQDLYHVDLDSGERQLVVEKVRSSEQGHLSPDGRYVAYVDDAKYRVFDSEAGEHHTVAADIDVSWVDEENDRPMEAGSYGVAGWLDDNSAFLAYDRFDIWKISVDGDAVNLTQRGRDDKMRFRVQRTDDEVGLNAAKPLLLHAYHDEEKYHGFYQLDVQSAELTQRLQNNKRYQYLDYVEAADRLLFTEEDFRQFPDIWSAPNDFSERTQLTDINPQIDQFKWGNAELIDWQTDDGEALQGIVIKPDDYDPERTYPVLVYYYEKYSQRLYHFNQMKVNHRPNFPFYVGQDYVVFLPDVRFRLGAPGPSATESLVPGVQKLIDEGIADADAIGLHGHSWSGYQSAFVVTETDMFAAAVAGAPVSNMTSAYTGIRWGSGLARQFQYETGQSRIGPSMYEDLDPYIKNSPVFFADKINTPMVIQFGDDDGAVPWEQGIEYYLALRRLNKEVVMLHYEDEPHHLQRYANKIDYTVKMKEFFDHYLKGEDAPDWWVEGMPYQQYDD